MISSLLRRLLEWLGQSELSVPPWLTWTLTAIFAVLLVHGLARWLARSAPAPAVTRQRAPASVVEVTQGAALTFEAAMDLALQALRQGDTRQALWISHRLLLLRLDEKEAIRFGDGKTNGDYLRECDRGHPCRALLGEFTALYERVVYGHRPASTEQVAELLAAVERL
ncbi:MAG: DUF4129 domain-containing protein [Candidatus Eremiobacterota bacterium]